MRQSDRYNPSWERNTRADYIEVEKNVKIDCRLHSEMT